MKLDCEGSEEAILQALKKRNLLTRVRYLRGEWHASDDRASTTAVVLRGLSELLRETHWVTFAEPIRRREGHFEAAALHWLPG